MRHRARARKLGRTSAHRLAMYRNLVTSLLRHEKIETTDARAKEVRRLADRMITLGKRGDLHAHRRALRVIREREVAAKVFGELAERYRTRPGGYTRVMKRRNRVGDAAALSIVQLVEPLEDAASAPSGKSRKKSGTRKAAGKKAASKKAPAKKAAASKTASKKAGTKKTATKKAATRKAASKKKTSKKSD